MDRTNWWRKQTLNKPLFEDILWSRPETTQGAGKLFIIGGNLHGFGAPGVAYSTALNAGAGVCHVLLPDAVRKTVKHILPDAEYAPSNPSGSFSKKSLDSFISGTQWADMVLLAGDFGRNSETASLLESFITKSTVPVTITQDAVDYFKETPSLILNRPLTTVVCSIAQLQRMFITLPSITPITYGMGLHQLVDALHEVLKDIDATIVTRHNENLIVAHKGQVVTHPSSQDIWRVTTAAYVATLWMQNIQKPLEAAASALTVMHSFSEP